MADCSLQRLNPRWFWDKESLITLELDENQFTELPVDAFDMPILERLGLAGNNLEVLNSTAFARSMTSLVNLGVENNQIDAIDERIFDEMTNLDSLTLQQNRCADAYFVEVQANMQVVREYLQGCFDNFARN
jgi:Leucine-rich repeat (LRR) protein